MTPPWCDRANIGRRARQSASSRAVPVALVLRELTSRSHASRARPSLSPLLPGVNEGYKSPSGSPFGSPTTAAYPFSTSAAGSPSTTPTRARPGLLAAYASSPPARAFISDRDARELAAQQQQLAGAGAPSPSSSSAANPFLASSSSFSSSSSGMAMDLDGASAAAGGSTTVPRHPSPLKRTSRARSRSPESSPPALVSGPGGSSTRKIRALPGLRATKSLPAPAALPLVDHAREAPPRDGYGALAGGWETPPLEEFGDDAMGGVEEAAGGDNAGSAPWANGAVSKWALSEDF